MLKIFRNRNSILVLAVILGLTIGDIAHYIKPYTIYMLAFIMIFSTTGIRLKAITDWRKAGRYMLMGIVYNYLILSGLMLILVNFADLPPAILSGIVVIASSPPGVAILPFTLLLRGNEYESMLGLVGAYFSSVLLAPLIISTWSSGHSISPLEIVQVVAEIIVVPFLLSRLLLRMKIYKSIEKYRGSIVNWGFAAIIFTAVGVNRDVFFSEPSALWQSFVILLASIFGLGLLHNLASRYVFKTSYSSYISQNLMVTIKSSGYSAATALALFGSEAAIPSAVLSIMVLLYLLLLSFRN